MMRGFGALLALAVIGCGTLVEPADHKIWNRSAEAVDVFLIRIDGESTLLVGALKPGTFYPLNYGAACPDMTLSARTAAGVEIDHRTGPFCKDDDWLIDGLETERPVDRPTHPEITPTPVPT